MKKIISSQNKQDCPCKRIKCRRHGNCSECLKYHHSQGHPAWCQRKKLDN